MTTAQPGDKRALGGVSGPGQSEEASMQGPPARGKSEPENCKEGVDPKGQPAVGSGSPRRGRRWWQSAGKWFTFGRWVISVRISSFWVSERKVASVESKE